MAFILTPPIQYKVSMSELTEKALNALDEVLNLPVIQKVPKKDKFGKPSYDKLGNPIVEEIVQNNIANSKARVAEIILNRVYGNATQKLKIDQRVVTMNLDAKDAQSPRTIEELDQRIKELEESKTRTLIDVKAASEEETKD